MYDLDSKINALNDNRLFVPCVFTVPGELNETSLSSVRNAQNITDTFGPKLQVVSKSRISRMQGRKKHVSFSIEPSWTSMVSHNSGAAAAKRRAAKARHRNARLILSLSHKGDIQNALSEPAVGRHVILSPGQILQILGV
jgi:hypothetical protein